MNELGRAITNTFCSRFKDRIDKDECYEDYLQSLTKQQLERLIKISAVMEGDNNKLSHILLVSMHKKKDVLDDFKKNIKDVFKTLIGNVSEDILIQLEIYLKEYKKSIFEIDLINLKYSLHFIEVLNDNCLAKVKYSKKENKLYLFTPKEIQLMLKEILKDKELRKEIKNNSIITDNLYNIIATYGVIPLKKLGKIYNDTYKKINTSKLAKRIMINGIFSSDIKLISVEDDYIVYGIGFEDEDMALEFYYSLPEDIEYKTYTKNEYEEIGQGIFHQNFEEYERLYNFLYFNLGMTDEEINNFDEMYILDYMYSYQIDAGAAKKNLSQNLNSEFIKLGFNEKLIISKSILSIARNYPNFNFKGYSYNDIKKTGI